MTQTRTLVVGPYLNCAPPRQTVGEGKRVGLERPLEARLAEALGLARAIGLEIVAQRIFPLVQIRPATFLGKGQISELATLVDTQSISLVVMDCALSPVQQRNLEKALSSKVIDRTGLILEIFGRRARTREGTLQVELAHLAYQKSRLVRSWTHLERQRGGFGFLGGPGETQIEADRRQIGERMLRIERELEDVKRTRSLHRKSRRAVPFPTVALVGYTNAGKSTLFNKLTEADVVVADQLFATLDPTLRKVVLPHGGEIILSDTVGFISGLPTMLIKAFRATLEEVLEADLILHVRDLSHEDAEAQQEDVGAVLGALGVDPSSDPRYMEVWNKCDLLDAESRASANLRSRRQAFSDKAVLISAVTGEGIDELRSVIESSLAAGRALFAVTLDPADGAGLNWLYENAEILSKTIGTEGQISIEIRLVPERIEALRRRFKDSVSVFAPAPRERVLTRAKSRQGAM